MLLPNTRPPLLVQKAGQPGPLASDYVTTHWPRIYGEDRASFLLLPAVLLGPRPLGGWWMACVPYSGRPRRRSPRCHAHHSAQSPGLGHKVGVGRAGGNGIDTVRAEEQRLSKDHELGQGGREPGVQPRLGWEVAVRGWWQPYSLTGLHFPPGWMGLPSYPGAQLGERGGPRQWHFHDPTQEPPSCSPQGSPSPLTAAAGVAWGTGVTCGLAVRVQEASV